MGDGLLSGEPESVRIYLEELKKLGKDPSQAILANGNAWQYVSNDPEKAWDAIAPYVIHAIECYSVWMLNWNTPPLYPPVSNKEDLRKTGLLKVLTPEEAVKAIAGICAGDAYHDADLHHERGRLPARRDARAYGVVRVQGDA